MGRRFTFPESDFMRSCMLARHNSASNSLFNLRNWRNLRPIFMPSGKAAANPYSM